MGIFNFRKKKGLENKFHENSQLIGIYKIDGVDCANLVEIIFEEEICDFDCGEITQEIRNQDKLDWQTAYDEKYLNPDGTKIIGDDFDQPKELVSFRIVFFFHYLDISKPLISQYGLINLTEIKELPERLKKLIEYREVD